MKFKLILSRLTKFTKVARASMIILLIPLLISVFTWNYEKGNNYLALSILIIYILIFFISLVRSFVIKDFIVIGDLILTSDSIVVDKEDDKLIFNIADIESLRVNYYGYDGESFPYSYQFSLSNFNQKQGNKNYIEIVHLNNLYRFEFFIKNRTNSLSLLKFVENYRHRLKDFQFINQFGRNDLI